MTNFGTLNVKNNFKILVMIKRILAIIPARGGSKAFPRKNIITLAGKPLIAWTISAALNSKYITKTVVSTDDNEISNISKKEGVTVIKRPIELATDTSSSVSAVRHVLDYYDSNGETFDIVILLQPTSPLRTSKNIDDAFKIMLEIKAKSLISVCETDNKFLKSFTKTSFGYLQGISNNKYTFMRRQDLPITYLSNGAIYIIFTKEFLKFDSFFTDKTIEFIMSKEQSVDIDSPNDLHKAELIFNSSFTKK